MDIIVHNHYHGSEEISKQLSLILKNTNKIMALIDDLTAQNTELNTKVDALQATVDAEQADIAALLANNAQVVTDLTAQNADLTAQLAAGASPAQLQALIDANTAIIAKSKCNDKRVFHLKCLK